MIVNTLMALSMTLTGPKISNVIQYNNTFNKTYIDTAREQGSNYDNYAVYYSYGQDQPSVIGGPTQRGRAIQEFSITNYTTWLSLKVNLMVYIEVNSNSYSYNGQQKFISNIQIDKSLYDSIGLSIAEISTQDGYDVNTISSIMFSNETTYQGRKNQITAIDTNIINTSGYNVYQTIGSVPTDTPQITPVIATMNDQANRERYISDETPNNKKGYVLWINLLKAGDPNMSAQDIELYRNSLNNYIQSVTYNLTIVENGTGSPVHIDYEVIDLAGLMFTILGMPFAWISTAYNLTLFPATPYAINVSHIFMAVISVTVLIFIIKKLIR